ncbi:MAG: DUF3298 domain-containing protein [Bacteroidia bacterium]|nr:DUF3298 domain-containing protein [Bacteroidia bacterium]
MKQLIFIFLLALIVGCRTTNTPGLESYEVLYISHPTPQMWHENQLTSFYVNRKNDTTIAILHYTIASLESPIKTLTDSITNSFLGTNIKVPLDYKAMDYVVDSFLYEYQMLDKSDTMNFFAWEWDVTLQYDTVFTNYLIADFSQYSYTGGAHGNSVQSFYTIDLNSKKVLNLQDICSNVPELEKRMEVVFRKLFEISPKQNLEVEGFWFANNQFKLNNNFYFDKEKLVFLYNQYEVAAYAVGQIRLEIPLNSVKDILKISIEE